MTVLPGRKGVAVITEGPYYRGSCKAGFNCMPRYTISNLPFLWIEDVPTSLKFLVRLILKLEEAVSTTIMAFQFFNSFRQD